VVGGKDHAQVKGQAALPAKAEQIRDVEIGSDINIGKIRAQILLEMVFAIPGFDVNIFHVR
jgi:hypothetical protein